MTISEFEKMSEKELRDKVFALRKELFELKLSAVSTHVKDNSQFKKKRASIARALTSLKLKDQG